MTPPRTRPPKGGLRGATQGGPLVHKDTIGTLVRLSTKCMLLLTEENFKSNTQAPNEVSRFAEALWGLVYAKTPLAKRVLC